MADLTLILTAQGSMILSPFPQPPPPIIHNSVCLKCTTDGASVSAVSLIVPSLSKKQAVELAEAFRKAADTIVSPAVVRRAGSAKDPGVVIDLLPVVRPVKMK
jgi:hypothetical protein